jgi:hypothetical protein
MKPRWLALAIWSAGLAGCHPRHHAAAPPRSRCPVRFREIAAEAGIDFRQGHGGRHPLDIAETSGCGGAILDADGDGWPDILLVGQPRCALYRNTGSWKFERLAAADRDLPVGRWEGCAAADYDADGRVDLLLTAIGALALLHNQGGGRFRDVTRAAGLASSPLDWWTSAGWADVDGDGRLDLYVGRYLTFKPGAPRSCTAGLDAEGRPVQATCGPELYAEQKGVLFLNRGAAARSGQPRFVDATRAWGLEAAHGRALGLAFGDFNNDGWPDLYVANDRLPCDLFVNRGGRRFDNVGLETGTAYAFDGRRQAGMGVDWGDFDNDGRLDLCVTTFYQEPKSLYHNEGSPAAVPTFREVSAERGLGPAFSYVGWGVRWLDADNDGALDLLMANGHAQDGLEQIDAAQPYLQPPLFCRQANGAFEILGSVAGDVFRQRIAGRGVATGDLDGDGRVDALITNGEGAPLLLRNESPCLDGASGHWLAIRLKGAGSNRQGIGARVTCSAFDGSRQTREVTTGGSYLCASEPVAHFGLGSRAEPVTLRIRWPGGREQEVRPPGIDRVIEVAAPRAR